jgi:hypothetical protein
MQILGYYIGFAINYYLGNDNTLKITRNHNIKVLVKFYWYIVYEKFL